MTKYQLGTASIHGVETSVIKLPKGLYILNSILPPAHGSSTSVLSLFEIFSHWDQWQSKLLEAVEDFVGGSRAAELLDEKKMQWLAPIRFPRAFICLGENYADHVNEMSGFSGLKVPYAFLKPAHTTMCGSGQDVPLLKHSRMNDWEAELAVVIGRTVRDVVGDDVMGCVAGYSIINDVSARDWIKDKPSLGLDWVMQKASDHFGPMGPYVTPAEFVPDCQNLNISLAVNGKTMQNSNTSKMVFKVREVIKHLSKFMTLSAGDVISTGTPSGTGFGHKPQIFLKPGDVTRVTIEGLGTLENRFV